jgi:hypothetical protein
MATATIGSPNSSAMRLPRSYQPPSAHSFLCYQSLAIRLVSWARNTRPCRRGYAHPERAVGTPGETGDAPVHLHGCGGCGIGAPFYNPAFGKRWREPGGASLMTHEFGLA